MEHGPIQPLATARDAELPVLGHVPSHLRFWLPSVLLLWLDLWSKAWAFTNLPANEGQTIIPKFLEFRRSLNDGAVFGSFTGYVSVFIGASLLALGFVFYMFARSARWQCALHMALGMILAGAIGNLYDRALIQADVVRFAGERRERPSIIGHLVESDDPDIVRIGDWPEGANPRTFKAETVTLHRQGVVRDFIKFMPKFPSSWPRVGGYDMWPWIFNVADAALVCGVALLLLHGWFDRPPKNRADVGPAPPV